MFSRKSYSPLSYFPPVWFVEDETTVPIDDLAPIYVQGGSSGGAAYDDSQKRKRKKLLEEQAEEDDMSDIMLVIQSFLHAQSPVCSV